ncbi:hypothetical protein NDU88_000627 [Pleurodeles waltl]|uniref:Uncharacterized protein n=1 Tax=Pleurodeles waltl TaxID=8319 RepID=A0AAV7P1D8_PLEWA|nr:hypothetical protein NDU88_000627 [Pleurodeles waltl]
MCGSVRYERELLQREVGESEGAAAGPRDTHRRPPTSGVTSTRCGHAGLHGGLQLTQGWPEQCRGLCRGRLPRCRLAKCTQCRTDEGSQAVRRHGPTGPEVSCGSVRPMRRETVRHLGSADYHQGSFLDPIY